jgi:DNA-damage-inducible protein D
MLYCLYQLIIYPDNREQLTINGNITRRNRISNLIAKEYKPFESIKHISDDGNEFWYARELSNILEYVQWRNFVKVLDRGKLACKNSGYEINDRFVEVNKTIDMPKSATKQVTDYQLTRYACYLIVQNGDPRKEVIALGQT